jgi:hypothetical protein
LVIVRTTMPVGVISWQIRREVRAGAAPPGGANGPRPNAGGLADSLLLKRICIGKPYLGPARAQT